MRVRFRDHVHARTTIETCAYVLLLELISTPNFPAWGPSLKAISAAIGLISQVEILFEKFRLKLSMKGLSYAYNTSILEAN